ncbi:hypothetical protein Aperf_G00000103892 [Anoplocephala perfoliata]
MLSEAYISRTDSPKAEIVPVANFDSAPSNQRKCVRFPEDDEQLATEFRTSGSEAWCVDPNTPNHKIIDRYAEACLKLGRPPLSTIIEQLSKVTTPITKTRIAAIVLKGTQLIEEDIEALEVIFKYCQTYHLSFENTNLTAKSLTCLLEALDYYAPCSELCLARNKRIGTEGIKAISTFVSKYPLLTWLDLRGIPLLLDDAKSLRRAITFQREEARKILKNFLATCTDQEPVNPDSARDAEEDLESFQLNFNAFISKSFATPAELNSISGALQRLPPMCLRGLHLGETGLCGAALADVAAAIRLAGHLRDLRLNGNHLGPRDIETLVPMLRYHPNLQVIDLSHNDLGDEGYRLLSNSLALTSYPSSILPSSAEGSSKQESICNLRRIYLSATGLRPTGAKHFASCFPALVSLTHLELSDNPQLGCQGMITLRSALQAYTRKCLVYLGLANCSLACQGAIALAEVLGDAPRILRRIDLTGNHIAEAGLLAISKSIPLCGGLVHLQGLEDNRPIRKPRSVDAMNGAADGNHTQGTGRSVPTTPPGKFSMFRLSRAMDHGTENSSDASIWHRRRSVSRTLTTVEPSQLSLDLLQTIHLQLAANLDRHLATHGRDNGKKRSLAPHLRGSSEGQGLSFFRGYVRLPPSTNSVRPEIDPRHLCGDTSESDLSDSDPEEEPVKGIDKPTVENVQPPTPQSLDEQQPFSDDDGVLRTDCVEESK